MIRLTNTTDNRSIYINVDCVGHLYQVPEKTSVTCYGNVIEKAHTIVGVTTHNNGGFKVTEDMEQIIKMIIQACQITH